MEWNDFAPRLYDMGFERGWGRDAAKTKEQIRLLLDILQVGRGNRMMGVFWSTGVVFQYVQARSIR